MEPGDQRPARDAGGGRLRLVGGFEPDSDGVFMTVQDEGIGIPAEDLDGLFQPFHGTFAKGSGLGLAIVHRIVADYSGEIQVSRKPVSARTVGSPSRPRGGRHMSAETEPSRSPPTQQRPHSRRRRRAIHAGAAGDRPPAGRLRRRARRQRPRRD